MGMRYWGWGWAVGLLTMTTATAQDHRHYEYYVDVQNGLNESVAIGCNGKPPVWLQAGESRSINVHGGEALRVRCTASDHHGQPLMRQVFELDHHDNRADWPLGQGEDDHAHDERNERNGRN